MEGSPDEDVLVSNGDVSALDAVDDRGERVDDRDPDGEHE